MQLLQKLPVKDIQKCNKLYDCIVGVWVLYVTFITMFKIYVMYHGGQC